MGDKLSMVALDKFEKRLSIPLRVKRARTRPADRPFFWPFGRDLPATICTHPPRPFRVNGKERPPLKTTERKTMSNEAENTKERKREVLTRFTQSELDAMKKDTGAEKDAAAVAAYARKRLAAERANA